MKQAITTAILLVSCATTPPLYAHRDYEQYPAYAKDVALHNIARIFSSECVRTNAFGSSKHIFEVNAGHLYCEQTVCKRYMQIPTGNWSSASTCTGNEDHSFDVPWLDVIEPRFVACPGGGCVNFSVSSRKFDFKARNARQAEELAEAIRIYKE